MSTKISFEEIKNYFEKHGFKVLDENGCGGTYNKINIIDDNGYKYFISRSCLKHNIKNNYNPFPFAKNNPYTIENIKLWIFLNNKPYTFHHGEYINSQDKSLFFQCNKCLEIWNAQWSVIGLGVGCPYCNGKRVCEKNSLSFKRHDLVIGWDYERNYPLTPDGITVGSSKRIWWICSICGCNWETILYNRTGNVSGRATNCPNCRKSSGEFVIKRFLDNNKIFHIPQKDFPDCRYKQPLYFDFFLPKFNMCIEYQGEQHYMPVNFGNMNEFLVQKRYNDQIIKDEIKRDYCVNKNINLLIIPYWDFSNIEKILKDNLNNNMNLFNFKEEYIYESLCIN